MTKSSDNKYPLLKLFIGYWDGFKIFAVLGPVFKVLEVVFDLLVPQIVAQMVDLGVKQQNINEIKHLGFLLICMSLIGFLCTVVAQFMASKTSQGIAGVLRSKTFSAVSNMSKSQRDEFGISSLLTRITSDINQIQLAISLGNRQLIRWPILTIGSIIAAISINPQLGLIFLVTTPLVAYIFFHVISSVIPQFSSVQETLDESGNVVFETLSGSREVKAFNASDIQKDKFNRFVERQAKYATLSGKISSLLNPATFFVMDLGIVCILGLASGKVNEAYLEQGQILAFVNYMTQTLLAVGYVANLVVVITRGSASASRVLEVLNCRSSISFNEEKIVDPNLNACAIECEEVCFTYPKSNGEVLSNISFNTDGFKSLGIIGSTGSGKSTLLSLFARFYDVSSGSIKLFGNDISLYTKSQLSHLVSYVSQTPSLTQATLKENLSWRNPGADDSEIIQALTASQALSFVEEKNKGIYSEVESDGANFSGGQKQRLTVARSLVGPCKILLLDAATSALDFKTSANLMRAISEGYKDIFCVVVSERVGQVSNCDCICVLDKGKLVGFGTHAELLKSCSEYKELVESQAILSEVLENE